MRMGRLSLVAACICLLGSAPALAAAAAAARPAPGDVLLECGECVNVSGSGSGAGADVIYQQGGCPSGSTEAEQDAKDEAEENCEADSVSNIKCVDENMNETDECKPAITGECTSQIDASWCNVSGISSTNQYTCTCYANASADYTGQACCEECDQEEEEVEDRQEAGGFSPV